MSELNDASIPRVGRGFKTREAAARACGRLFGYRQGWLNFYYWARNRGLIVTIAGTDDAPPRYYLTADAYAYRVFDSRKQGAYL